MSSPNQVQNVRALHPDDPDIAYVAAIGNLWGYSGDRGLFKTSDGGKSWHRLTQGLPDDGKHGATDLVMDPSDPHTLYTAFYHRIRRPYRFDSGGRLGGIFKSSDAGKSWKKLSNGLPEGETGRIGLAVYRQDPRILMAFVEHGFQPRENDPDFYDLSKLGTGWDHKLLAIGVMIRASLVSPHLHVVHSHLHPVGRQTYVERWISALVSITVLFI